LGSLADDQRALFYRPPAARRAIAKSIERHRALSPDVAREPESLARQSGRARMETQPPPIVQAPLARVLLIEPVTSDGSRDLAYWNSVDADPLMVVLVEAIDSAAEPTPELLADVRAGTITSNVFPFSTLALALAFADRETDNGDATCIVLAKRIDEPAYGERGPGLLC
jgi:hypothetical protein